MSVREGCKREERSVREGRDGVREDGVRDGKEAKVVQRGAGYVQRKAHTNNHREDGVREVA